jgi:hypothetical protein
MKPQGGWDLVDHIDKVNQDTVRLPLVKSEEQKVIGGMAMRSGAQEKMGDPDQSGSGAAVQGSRARGQRVAEGQRKRWAFHAAGLLMAPPIGGGDQGGFVENPAHPKPIRGSSSPPPWAQQVILGTETAPLDDSNWDDGSDGEESLGFQQGHESKVGGEVDMEDNVFLEFDEDEEPVQLPPQQPNTWRLIARYCANFKPNTTSMFTHFVEDVWRLWTGIRYTERGKNYYMITLFSQGDYDFVMRGGPWIFKRNALLIKDLGKIQEAVRDGA